MRRTLTEMIDIRKIMSPKMDNTSLHKTHCQKHPPFSVPLDDEHNRYKVILKPIGTGGSSHVFKAFDTKTEQFVAVKIVDVRHMSHADYTNARNETIILKMLDHPNVIQMKDCFDVGRLPEHLARVIRMTPKDTVANHGINALPSYADVSRKQFSVIVYPLCKGDLFEHIAQNYYEIDTERGGHSGRALSEEESKRIFRSICLGLEHCHSRHIAHRDIKAENILLDSEGVPKLADFGFAIKLPFAEFKASDPVGTVRSVAPEVLTGEKYDAIKSDIWSLGLLLYFMLLGTFPCPHDDEDVTNIINYYDELWEQSEDIQLQADDGEFSAELHHLISSLLTFEPSDRLSIQQILAHPWLRQE